MIEIYAHHLYYSNGSEQTFDADKPLTFEPEKLYNIRFPNGDVVIVNPKYLMCANIKHLTLTEEEYEKRKNLLNNK